MSKPVHPHFKELNYLHYKGINTYMPVEINKVDTFQTRFFNSFENLTKADPSNFPAITSVRIEPYYNVGTATDLLTSYTIYDQYALRVVTKTLPSP